MKQLFLFLLSIALLASCNSGNSSETAEVIETDSIPVEVEEPKTPEPKSELVKESTSFPFMTAESLKDYDLERTHEYGGGDCWASVLQYASGKDIVCIDSLTCGEYYYTTTRYMLSDNKLMMVHIANVSNMDPSWEETIYDFRKEPYAQYERKGVVKNEADKKNAYENKPLEASKVAITVKLEDIKKEYLSLFKREKED